MVKSIALGVVAVWALIATLGNALNMRGREAAEERLKAVEARLAKADHAERAATARAEKAERAVADGRARADAGERAAEAVALKTANELQRRYKNLHRFRNTLNVVKERYVDGFEVIGDRVKVVLANRGKEAVTPRFTIYLLNAEGFVTESVVVRWLLTSISPGETRVDDEGSRYRPRFGSAVYYFLDFD